MSFPNRIICLTEETTEILYELGAEDLIVGISGYTVRPKRARKEKPKVSAFSSAKIDKITELNPDLVLGFSDIQSDICSELIKRGINVLCFNQRSVNEILNVIRLLGRIINKSEKAENYAKKLEAKLNKISNLSKKLKFNPKVYFEEWDDPLITGIKWVSELIEIAGGIDIFKNKSFEPIAVNRIIKEPNTIVDANPDIIIGSWCGKKFKKEKIVSRYNWHSINAVKNNHIYEIKSPLILQPGPAALTVGLDEIVNIILKWKNKKNNLFKEVKN